MDGKWLVIAVIIIVLVYLMGEITNIVDFVKSKFKEEHSIPDSTAIRLADEYKAAFYGPIDSDKLNKMDELSEKIIEMSTFYFSRYDFESWKCLKRAVEDTSYVYHGNKYPQELVEDIIQNEASKIAMKK